MNIRLGERWWGKKKKSELRKKGTFGRTRKWFNLASLSTKCALRVMVCSGLPGAAGLSEKAALSVLKPVKFWENQGKFITLHPEDCSPANKVLTCQGLFGLYLYKIGSSWKFLSKGVTNQMSVSGSLQKDDLTSLSCRVSLLFPTLLTGLYWSVL